MRSRVTFLFKIIAIVLFAVGSHAVMGKYFENFLFQGNTIQATNTNGNITLRPNGSGVIENYGKGNVISTGSTDIIGGDKLYTDNVNRFSDNGDSTKRLAFELSGITTATTRTWTAGDFSGEVVIKDATQVLSNKFLINPNVQGYALISGTEREVRFADDDSNYIALKVAGSDIPSSYTIDLTTLGRSVGGLFNCDGASVITSQYPTGSFTAIGNISSGACTVTIATGLFSASPYCVASYAAALTTAIVTVSVAVASSTSVTVDCLSDAGGSAAVANCGANDFNMTCYGPRQ